MNASIYKGSLESAVLLLLESQGELYGYGICMEIKKLSSGNYTVNEGALYPLLQKLEMEELIDSFIRKHNRRNRKYYRLTQKGSAYAAEKKLELNKYFKFINNLMKLNPI